MPWGALVMHPETAASILALPAGYPARRLPTNLSILRALEARGVVLARAVDEDLVDYECRIETGLMALFRDVRGEVEFQALYEYTRASLLVWIGTSARSLGGACRRLDPLELLQDAYVNIYRYAGGFREDQKRSFRVWSRTIATNLMRRNSGRRTALSLQAFPEGLQEPRDPRADPSESLSISEEQRAFALAWMIVLQQYRVAWSELGERDRIAIDLIEVQGLSYAEAGARLRVGLSNMKMIMFRARRRIRARIALALEAHREPARAIAV